LQKLQQRWIVFNWRRSEFPPTYVAPHKKMRCFAKEKAVKFENATSLMLAIAAQALAVGIILAL
jgi:hypothetical protein